MVQRTRPDVDRREVGKVTKSALDRVADLLGGVTGQEAFSATRTAPAGDLHLEVRGVGPVEVPVSEAQARRLCEIARPARYGRGELTLLDRAVRDTWEIPKSRVKIDKRRFDQTLVPVVDRLGQDLGLPAGRLRAELHSVLVYAPGQFFVQHQDSEKDDSMVASLVVSLPSTFTGGALEVHHDGRIATYRGSKKALSFVAFYPDCRHQIKPVRSGHRVVLTYNLLLRANSDVSGIDPDPELTGQLASCIEEHFTAPDAPGRLAYLLDHEYTPRGLGWSRLKGADHRSAGLLRAAAQQAGCDATLGLVDVHETWDAFEVERRWGRSRYRRWEDWDWDDEIPGSSGDDDYELGELIERDTILEALIDPAGAGLERVGLRLCDNEVCETVSSDDLKPYSSEYEGYMGNWGNTLDRWYHRGAVVLWPRTRAFAVRAEAFPTVALETLAARVRRRDLTGAREAAATLAPFWDKVAARVEHKGFFTKALRTAHLLDDAQLAGMLLHPFRIEMITTGHAKPLAALVERYGEPWARDLVTAWSAQRRRYHPKTPNPKEWMAALPGLTGALQKAGEAGATAARILLEDSWAWASPSIEAALGQSAPSRCSASLSELTRPVAAVLESASLIGAQEVRNKVVGCLCRDDDDDLVGLAIGVLRATPQPAWSATGLDRVVTHCAAALEGRLALPPRAPGDWSMQLPAGCGCALCVELRAFLADPAGTSYEWPLAKDSRAHVHGRIDTAEIPVTHQTRRTGRPYTLVLTKTDAVFELDRQHRARDQADLDWLRGRGARASSSKRTGQQRPRTLGKTSPSI